MFARTPSNVGSTVPDANHHSQEVWANQGTPMIALSLPAVSRLSDIAGFSR